jgi:CheY-like chemotaxis protein
MRVVLLTSNLDLTLVRSIRDGGHDLWHALPDDRAYKHTRDAFPGAVLIDLAKDAERGFAAAAALAASPRTASTPVVLFNAKDVTAARARAPYARALLLAPSRNSDLLRALQAFEAEE